jgi:hypothetical protein
VARLGRPGMFDERKNELWARWHAGHSFANQTEHAARALLICTPGGFEGFLTEVAEFLPDQAPDGPPPASAVEAMQAVGARYGLLLHLD